MDSKPNKKGQTFRIYASAGSTAAAGRFIRSLRAAIEVVPLARKIPKAIDPVRFDLILVQAAARATRKTPTGLAEIRDRMPRQRRTLQAVLQRILGRQADVRNVYLSATLVGLKTLKTKVRRHELTQRQVAPFTFTVLYERFTTLGNEPGARFLVDPAAVPLRPRDLAKRLRSHKNEIAITVKPMGKLPAKGIVWFAFDPKIAPGHPHYYILDARTARVRIRAKRGTETLIFRRYSKFLDLGSKTARAELSDRMTHTSDKRSRYIAIVTTDKGGKYSIYGGWEFQRSG